MGAGGPERFLVTKPETIIPAPESRALALADASSGEKPALPAWVDRFQKASETASSLIGGDTPQPAVRPRRALPPAAQEILARANGGDQPVSDEPSPYQPAAPSDLPTTSAPYYGVVGGDVEARTAPPDVRPRVAQPEQFLERRVADDMTAPAPRDHNGRLKSALKGLARGFLRGGAAGAILGAGAEAIDPSIDERQDFARQSAEDRSRLGQMYAMEDEQFKRASEAADVGAKRAQAYRALHPLPDFERVEGDDGAYLYDKHDPAAGLMKLPVAPKGTKPQAFDWLGRKYEWEKDPDTNKWVPRPLDNLPVEESEVPVDYYGYKVKPGVAASGTAQTTAANVTAGNQYGNQSYEDTVRRKDEDFRQEQQNYSDALGAIRHFNDRHDQLDEMGAELDGLNKLPDTVESGNGNKIPNPKKDAARIAYLSAQIPRLREQLLAERQAIDSSYGRYAHFNDKERYEPGPRPQRQSYQQRPAPQMRPSPSQAGAAPKPITASSSEQEVRDAARYYGKDEGQAIEKWKKMRQGLDPQKAHEDSTQGENFGGARISRSKLAEFARIRGLGSEREAETYITGHGGVVY